MPRWVYSSENVQTSAILPTATGSGRTWVGGQHNFNYGDVCLLSHWQKNQNHKAQVPSTWGYHVWTGSITILPDPQTDITGWVNLKSNSVSKLNLEGFVKFIHFIQHLTCRTHYALTSSWFPKLEVWDVSRTAKKVLSRSTRPTWQHTPGLDAQTNSRLDLRSYLACHPFLLSKP